MRYGDTFGTWNEITSMLREKSRRCSSRSTILHYQMICWYTKITRYPFIASKFISLQNFVSLLLPSVRRTSLSDTRSYDMLPHAFIIDPSTWMFLSLLKSPLLVRAVVHQTREWAVLRPPPMAQDLHHRARLRRYPDVLGSSFACF